MLLHLCYYIDYLLYYYFILFYDHFGLLLLSSELRSTHAGLFKRPRFKWRHLTFHIDPGIKIYVKTRMFVASLFAWPAYRSKFRLCSSKGVLALLVYTKRAPETNL